jgi:O-antigen/teichoic acid export membrane protein
MLLEPNYKQVRALFTDRLYAGSLWLIIGSIVVTGFGFLFWTINARLFEPVEMGYGSALLSALELLSALSLLGFNVALLKYIPKAKDRNRVLNNCFSITAIVSIVLAIIFLLGVHWWTPKLCSVRGPIWAPIFIISLVFYNYYNQIGAFLVGIGKPHVTLVKDFVFSIAKLILPFMMVMLGGYAIFLSWTIAAALAFLSSLFFFHYKPYFVIDKSITKEMMTFSIINYLSDFLLRAPRLILPLVIASLVGLTATGYYHISWTMASIIYIIPNSMSKSFLAEGSLNGQIKENKKKAIKFIMIALVPAVVVFIIAAKYLLMMFGNSYSVNATQLVQIFALASVPFAINVVYTTIKNIQHNVGAVVKTNMYMAACTIVLSIVFIDYGIIACGLSWLFAQVSLSLYTSREVFGNV